MKKLTDHISVILTKKDFETTYYTDPKNCALATALKREGYELGGEYSAGVGGAEATIQGETYHILECNKIQESYRTKQPLQVNLLKL
jgi:hypothetical protein